MNSSPRRERVGPDILRLSTMVRSACSAALLVGPTAVVVSDRYAGYAHIDPSQRQVCWAECGRQVS